MIGVFNIMAAQWLAVVERAFALIHFVAFIPMIIAMWVLTPRKQSGRDALLNFTNNGTGWNNMGIVVLVGQVPAMFTLLGSDAAAHMCKSIYMQIASR